MFTLLLVLDLLIQVLLLVTLSCACAFASPIATPINALACGGALGSSPWRRLAVGALMNVAVAVARACYVFAFVGFGGTG